MIHRVNSFRLQIPSVTDGTRPANSWGTSVTPGNNTYGTYAQLIAGASVTEDAFGVLVNINSNTVSGAARDTLVTLGLDAAGGSSYTDFINHLFASQASIYANGGGGVWYYFPVFVKAGSSVAAKASVNNATVGTLRVSIVLMCRPTRPDLLRVGRFVRTFGETTASSSGTAITPGTAAEGAWTQLGSALAEPLWGWEYGIGINNATMAGNTNHVDVGIGDASNKKIAVRDGLVLATSAETLTKFLLGVSQSYCEAAAGDLVYGRAQVGPNAADTGYSMIAYGVGG